MFVDSAVVFVRAGKGGDGIVSFRHEKYVDKGGPDGGDGGRGGNVIFMADERKNTLVDFRYKPESRASDGEAGSKRQKHGKNGDDCVVSVPVGTQVFRDDILMADLDENGKSHVIARGGDGGFGNAHFKSSVRQTPRVAELGEKGDEFEARLELKLLADVGLVGLPNAGKSTFLSVVSNARPEIADYPFTTLTPNLGVADIDDSSLLIADIPGLIEGAHAGKGLGAMFLRHVERTSVLLHLIDAYSNDIVRDYQIIRDELEKYSPALCDRPEIIALTKIEGLDDEIIAMQIDALRIAATPEAQIYSLSSAAHRGLDDVLRALRAIVDSTRQALVAKTNEEFDDEEIVRTISLSSGERDSGWQVSHSGDNFVVVGAKIEKFAARTDFTNVHSVNRLRDIMKKIGVTHELVRAGASGVDKIVINDAVFSLDEQ